MTTTQTHDLQGLREALLTPFEIVRDDMGCFCHPALPATDEEVRADKLLAAFGLQSAFVCMEDECDDATLTESVFEGGSCAAWTPTTPKGEDWVLLAIYDTERGPYAMFARPAPAVAPTRRWRDDQHAGEWRNAERIADAPDVHEALLNFTENQTGDNGTCVALAVMRAQRQNLAARSDDDWGASLQAAPLMRDAGQSGGCCTGTTLDISALDTRITSIKYHAGEICLQMCNSAEVPQWVEAGVKATLFIDGPLESDVQS